MALGAPFPPGDALARVNCVSSACTAPVSQSHHIVKAVQVQVAHRIPPNKRQFVLTPSGPWSARCPSSTGAPFDLITGLMTDTEMTICGGCRVFLGHWARVASGRVGCQCSSGLGTLCEYMDTDTRRMLFFSAANQRATAPDMQHSNIVSRTQTTTTLPTAGRDMHGCANPSPHRGFCHSPPRPTLGLAHASMSNRIQPNPRLACHRLAPDGESWGRFGRSPSSRPSSRHPLAP